MEEKKDFTKEKNRKAIFHFRPMFVIFLLLLVGVIFARKIYFGDITYIILTVIIFLLVLFYSLHKKNAMFFAVCTLVFACGNGLYCLSILPFNNQPNYDKSVSIVGRIKDDIAYSGTMVTVTIENVKVDGEPTSNMSLKIYNCENLTAGNSIAFEGVPVKEPLFNLNYFRNSYVRDGVVYSCSLDFDEATFVEGGLKFDESVRKTIKDTLLSSMSEENAYIAYAVLTGEKSGIDGEIYNNYNASGMLHILTVSGLHIGIFAGMVSFLLKLCKAKRWLNFLLTAIILFLYCYICGFAPSVVRASVMYLVFLLSFLSGKQYDSLSSIGLAGIILILVNPLFVFDVGFLMSFFSVMFIAILFKPLSRLLCKIFPKVISQTMAITLCTMIGTLPFISSFYSNFNFLAIFANLFTVPFFSVCFVLLFAFLIITLILPFMNFLLVVSDWSFYALNFIASFYSDNVLSVPLTPLYEGVSLSGFLICLLISDFVMLSSRAKMVCLSVLGTIFISFVAVSFVPNRNSESEIYYLNSYSSYSPILYLKSRSGDSMLIDFEENFGTKRFLDFVRYSDINFYISHDRPSEKFTEFLKGREAKASYYFEEETENSADKQVIKAETNQTYDFGPFKFCFYQKGAKYLGTRVEFDDTSIFFAKSENLEYNELVYLLANVPKVKFLFLNNRLEYLEGVKHEQSISIMYSKNTKYSYATYGDMKIIDSGIIKVRGIG